MNIQCTLRYLPHALAFLFTVTTPGLCAAEPSDTNALPANIAAELNRLNAALDLQGQRLERLYRAIGPHMKELEEEASRLQQEQAEDKALLMEKVTDISDLALTGQGCVNPAAAEFAVITRGGAVQVLDERGRPRKTLRRPGQIIRALAFSPNGAELLAGTDAGELLVWDVANGTCALMRTNVGKTVGRVTWLGTNQLVWGANVSYWEGGKPANLDKPAGDVLTRENGRVLWRFLSFIRDDFFTLAGALDGRLLAVLEVPGQPRGAFLLDGAKGAILKTCYNGDGPLSVALSPDNKTLAVGYAPWDVILWDTQTGEQLKLLKGHSNWVVSLAFSANSKRLVSGAGDSTARVWDVETGKEIGRLRFEGQSTYVPSVGLSPEGNLAFALTQQGQLVIAKVPKL